MYSMTGFGAGRAESKDIGSISVEMRSVNNRFLEIGMRLPSEMTSFEPAVRSRIQKAFSRGKIYIDVRFQPIPGATQQFELNRPLLDMLEAVCREKGQTPSPDRLLSIPGVVISQTDSSCLEELEKLFYDALSAAIDAMKSDRNREGEVLRNALLEIQQNMKSSLADVEKARPLVVEKYRQKLSERIDDLLGPKGVTMDEGRLEQEIALFADKADVAEEITRLGAHLEQLGELLSPGRKDARGRALDFLNQEILREINTIGSKGRDLDITRSVLDLKNHAETMKEQLANVE